MDKINKSFFLFHLNLAFSSIEYHQHQELIDKCYFPLLKTFSQNNIKLGIELSGWTLERINTLSPNWIKLLKLLIDKNQVELISSGYCQVIGPLVPFEVNLKNHEIGIDCYQNILNTIPETVLVNEMAFSNGIAETYQDIGYKNIIMDGDNLSLSMDLEKELFFSTKYAVGDSNKELIKLLPTDSILFQKFQRVAHSDLDIKEYTAYLEKSISKYSKVATAIYCNDAEVFNFRPGRFAEEASINEDEWKNIEKILEVVKQIENHEVMLPRDICKKWSNRDCEHLVIESLSYPVPVKKQKKYNLARWAVTGRNDSLLNSVCYGIYNKYKTDINFIKEKDWRDLIFLWSSDHRTHITLDRWDAIINNSFFNKYSYENINLKPTKDDTSKKIEDFVIETDRKILIKTDMIFINLNKDKGMSIKDAGLLENKKNICLIGTIDHGDLDNIELGADFFSGSLVIQDMENAMLHSDLQKVDPVLKMKENYIEICSALSIANNKIEKIIKIYIDKPRIKIFYRLDSIPKSRASLRVSAATVKTDMPKETTVIVSSKTGGKNYHNYYFDKEFDHGLPVSHRISSTSSLSATNGKIKMTINGYRLHVSWDPEKSYFYPLFQYANDPKGTLTRLHLSHQEVDDTLKPEGNYCDLEYSIDFIKDI